MSLDPKTAARLMSDMPEVVQFVTHLRTEAAKLKDLTTLKNVANEDLPLEIRARERAYDVLIAIVQPLLDATTKKIATVDPKEYVT